MHIDFLSLSFVGLAHYMTSKKECTSLLFLKLFKFKKKKNQLMIEKYFSDLFSKNLTKVYGKTLIE